MYEKAPTSAGFRRHLWKASEISHFDRRTSPSAGSASHTCWRMRARQDPNCIAFGLSVISVEVLTDGVRSSGVAVELQMRRGLRAVWVTEARREILSRVPKWARASASVSMILNPRSTRSRSSALQKVVDSGVRVEV